MLIEFTCKHEKSEKNTEDTEDEGVYKSLASSLVPKEYTPWITWLSEQGEENTRGSTKEEVPIF